MKGKNSTILTAVLVVIILASGFVLISNTHQEHKISEYSCSEIVSTMSTTGCVLKSENIVSRECYDSSYLVTYYLNNCINSNIEEENMKDEQ